MRFEWDERKNQINLAKHGFDFADAYLVFNMPMVVELDERENYGEDRYIGIGLLQGRVLWEKLKISKEKLGIDD